MISGVMSTSSARGRMYQQTSSDRRALYKRSNTLASLPLGSVPVATPCAERCRLTPIKDSPVHEISGSSQAETVGLISGVEVADRRTSPRLSDICGGASVGSSTNVGRRATFMRKASCNDLLLTGRNKTLTSGDVAPTGNSLLAKVRDRIRETVLSTEWSPAVVLEERHQRAAEQFEAAARSRLQHQQNGTSSRRLSPVDIPTESSQQQQNQPRHHSPTKTTPTSTTNAGARTTHNVSSAVHGGRREAARIAFRRRSISYEDAYAVIATGTSSCLTVGGGPGRSLSTTSSAKGSVETIATGGIGAGGSSGGATPLSSRSASGQQLHGDGHSRNLQQQQRGGIICSNDDFKSLIAELGRHSKQSEMTLSISPSNETIKTATGSRRTSSQTPSPADGRRVSRQSEPDVVEDDEERVSFLTLVDVEADPKGCEKNNSSGNRRSIGEGQTDMKMDSQLCSTYKKGAIMNDFQYSCDSNTSIAVGNLELGIIEIDQNTDLICRDSTSGRRKSVAPPDIEFDDNGQTWDVYGAELDPHILGSAIQSHLERIMTSSLQATSGLCDGDVAEEIAVVSWTKTEQKPDNRTAGTDSGDYCYDRNRKSSGRKLMLCGGSPEPECDDDDVEDDERDDSQKSLLTRISCLCSE